MNEHKRKKSWLIFHIVRNVINLLFLYGIYRYVKDRLDRRADRQNQEKQGW